MIRFKIQGFVDPRLGIPARFSGIFENGSVKTSTYTFAPIDDCTFKEGEEIEAILLQSGFYGATTKAQAEQERLEQAKLEEKRKQEAQEKFERQQKEAISFNEQLRKLLPFQWDLGMNDVLSGLTENSDGSGRNSRTVAHIRLLESISIGRLKRLEFQFLCGSKGKRWSGSQNSKVEKVSCRECLRIAERIKRSEADGE